MNIKDYLIITDVTAYGLLIKVREQIKNSWIPTGGISIESHDTFGSNQYYQAMVMIK